MSNLGEHFKLNIENKNSKKECLFQGQKYRITVLTERLIRLEYSQEGIFYDDLSQLAINRNFNPPVFEVKEDDKYLQLDTKYFRLEYTKEKNFDGGKMLPLSNLRISLKETDKVWHYNHPEVRNYKGNYVSFDGTDNDRKQRNGLYSIDGFASINDSNSMLFNEAGELTERPSKNIDIYLFMYNKDFYLALQDYFKLTGFPPLIPRYALGNWWSRDYEYRDEDVKELLDDFTKKEIPLSVLLFDEAWHKNTKDDNTKIKTGFTFNKDLIKEPEELIKEIHQKNIKIGLNINPIEGIASSEENYKLLADEFGITDEKTIAFDVKNYSLLNSYFKNIINPLENKGVDFFWNDWKENDKDTKNLWLLNHYHTYNTLKDRSKRELLLTRNSLIASHRYPISYSGKTLVSWEILRKIPMYNQISSNIGVSFWSYDVAGNFGGVEEAELYLRSIQLAVFSPILRFSASRGKYYKREPWRWDVKTLEVARDYLSLRHKLIPYIYTEAYRYHKFGMPLIRPLYHSLPWVYDDTNYSNQYYFGEEIMVAPILNKKDQLMNRTVHKFFIPEGTWYDFKTGKKFPGNKGYISFYKEEDYPYFVKSGAIIPLSKDLENNNINSPKEMEIHVFPGQNNTYNLYEDDGISSLYKEGYHLSTSIDYNYLPSNYTVIIRSVDGKNGIVPEFRDYKIKFRNTKKAEKVTAYYNDTVIETKSYVYDNDFIVELKKVPTVGQVTINCKGTNIEIEAIRVINDDIDSILSDLPINTVLKEKISVIVFSSIPVKKKRIEVRKLKRYGLSKEYIKLFLKLLEYIEQI